MVNRPFQRRSTTAKSAAVIRANDAAALRFLRQGAAGGVNRATFVHPTDDDDDLPWNDVAGDAPPRIVFARRLAGGG
jgi:hypothetical protein